MSKNRLDVEKQTALVLQGLKGKIPLEELLRQYDVSEATYHMLRDRFIEAGKKGLKKESNRVKRYAIFAAILLAVIGSLFFNYSYKFQPKEFTGKLHHISRPSEGIGAYSIHVELPDGTYKTITLSMVISPYPWPIHERDHINKTFALARNKPIRVEVMKWNAKNRGTGFVYVNDEDIALLLLREGYLKVYPSDWEIDGKKMRDKLQTYQRAEELAMEEDKGIWGKFD